MDRSCLGDNVLDDALTFFFLLISIRAVVNVDSCGTTGREILFQANSREMIDAYKQAPYPHGTVMVQ